MSDAVSQWIIPDDKIAAVFSSMKSILESRDKTIFFDWTRSTLEEVTPNVRRSLAHKYNGCEEGYRASKIAGLYAFWIAKLKPAFSIIANFRALNEYAGLQTGIAYIKERLNIDIKLDRDELLEICETLRYHTSSPHTMMHIFALWVEREKLRNALAQARHG